MHASVYVHACVCVQVKRQVLAGVCGFSEHWGGQKATHTNQYLSDSHHLVAHKAVVVRSLMDRTSTLSLNSVERVAEEKKIMVALRDNGYPSGFIHRHSDNWIPRWAEDDQRLPRTSLTLPYIGELFEVVRRVLNPLHTKVAFRPLRTLRHQLVHPRTLYQGTSGQGWCIRSPARITPKCTLVSLRRPWNIDCLNNDWPFRVGMWLHLLWEHTWSTGHRMDLSKAEVVDAQFFVTIRCLLE